MAKRRKKDSPHSVTMMKSSTSDASMSQAYDVWCNPVGRSIFFKLISNQCVYQAQIEEGSDKIVQHSGLLCLSH